MAKKQKGVEGQGQSSHATSARSSCDEACGVFGFRARYGTARGYPVGLFPLELARRRLALATALLCMPHTSAKLGIGLLPPELFEEIAVGVVRIQLWDPRTDDKVDSNGRSGLFDAANEGSTGRVDSLLRDGANGNQAEKKHGGTPLTIAALKGHQDIVDALLAAGASSNQAKSSGNTPLMVAAMQGQSRIHIGRRAGGLTSK